MTAKLVRQNFTRIVGLSDRRRLPRLGKIRLGEKRQTDKGKVYPAALEYFRFDDDALEAFPKIAELYADPATGELAPKSLRIMFPSDDLGVIFPQAYKLYGSDGRLKCKGDGLDAVRMLCAQCGKMACKCNAEARETSVQCVGCEHRDADCKPMGSLMVLLPDISMAGVWQIDTKSINSIIDLNSGLDLIRSLVGRVALAPVTLYLEPRTVTVNGRGKTIHTLRLELAADLAEIHRLRASLPAPAALPELPQIEAPHDDGDDLPPVATAVEASEAMEGLPPVQDYATEDTESAPPIHGPGDDPGLPIGENQIESIQWYAKALGWRKADANAQLARYRRKRILDLSGDQADDLINRMDATLRPALEQRLAERKAADAGRFPRRLRRLPYPRRELGHAVHAGAGGAAG